MEEPETRKEEPKEFKKLSLIRRNSRAVSRCEECGTEFTELGQKEPRCTSCGSYSLKRNIGREISPWFWDGFPYQTDIVGIVLNKQIQTDKDLKVQINRNFKEMAKADKDRLFVAVRALDTFQGSDEDVKVIQGFGRIHGIEVLTETTMQG